LPPWRDGFSFARPPAGTRALGPQLRRDFGAGPFYTRQQIGKSAARAGLPMRHLAFGYAGFMDAASFAALQHLDTGLTYEQLRAMLARHTGRAVSAGFEPAPESPTMISGGGA
jgi:hypothetical protein